ncbi:hypothetical protein [Rhodococcus sp. NPDC060176]|uniref:hypothetical protein n=1 Tax=Rhodococcus sp. NPDC060176 TaxID=3347062 RepID=UPI00364B9FF9
MATSAIAWPTAQPATGYAGHAEIYDIEDGPTAHGKQLLVWTIIEPDAVDPDVERASTVVFTRFGGVPLFEGSVRSHEKALAACGYELVPVEEIAA